MKIRKISEFNLYFATLAVISIAVVGFGITTSSLGSLTPNGTLSTSLKLNDPLPIRSDEFLRASPTQLSVLQGSSSNSYFDFTQSDTYISTQGNWVEKLRFSLNLDYSIIFFIAQKLPIDMGFSIMWWLYSLMVLIFVPLWLKSLGLGPLLSIFGGLLTWLTPGAHWWSMWPLVPIGLSALSGYLFLKFVSSFEKFGSKSGKQIVASIALGTLTISVASRIPFTYQPWAMPVAIFFIAVSLAHIFFSNDYVRSQKLAATTVLAGSFLMTILYFIQSRKLFETLLATVYPGHRRSGVTNINIPIWSGPMDWKLGYLKNTDVILSNQSELSIGLLILIPVSIAVIIQTSTESMLSVRKHAFALAGAGVSFIFLAWTLAPWPSRLLHKNPLTLLPPERVAQILGAMVPVLFVICLHSLKNFKASLGSEAEKVLKRSHLTLGIFTLIVTLIGAQEFAKFVNPTIVTPKSIWLTSICISFIIVFPLVIKNAQLSLIPILIYSIFSITQVNPVMQGVGEIIHSEEAQTVQGFVNSNGQRWASDDMFLDALLIGNGAKMLSGQQGSGPNLKAWQTIDPEEEFENEWNRGSNYIVFAWDTTKSSMEIANPSPDIIQISTNPCDPKLKQLNLGWIATRGVIDSPCTTLRDSASWMGRNFSIYELN